MSDPDLPFGDERHGGIAAALRRGWHKLVTPATPPPGGPRSPLGPEPKRAGWTRILGVSLAAFALWLVLDAPTLQHNAQVSPVGTRRTVSLDILGPIATFSRDLGLSHVVSVADGLIGRRGNRPGTGVSTTPTTAPSPSVTTTTVPMVTLNRHPSAKSPLRVLVLGDSLGIDLGDVLVNDLSATGVVQATLDGQVSTGLTRPDYFDWPAELTADLPRDTPQVIVIMMGANDAQDLPGPPDVPFGTSTWDSTYRSRVAQLMEEATSRGAKVVWIGMPPMQNPGLSTAMARINGLVASEARKHVGVDYVASWTLIGTAAGQFTPYLVEGGQEVNVREPDGTHIAPGGAQVLSSAVEAALRSQFKVTL
ncbi:MAG: SGNH/GDSL hydrolase family protein [Acidimicrobiales bacterium]